MKISALIFDLDGTAIPNKPDGVPSEVVVNAVRRVQKKIPISIATGRSITDSNYIFKALSIKEPSIFAGGTQIYDPVKDRIVWEKAMPKKIVQKIIDLVKSYDYGIYVSDSLKSKKPSEIKISNDERVLCIMAVSVDDTKIILESLSKLSEIKAYKAMSWTKHRFDIHITHKNATKKNAMEELLKIFNISNNEVMVVGDSNNDMPLFELAGLRVAMGNGSEELKKQADYVTLGVEKNGLAHAIEKFILK